MSFIIVLAAGALLYAYFQKNPEEYDKVKNMVTGTDLSTPHYPNKNTINNFGFDEKDDGLLDPSGKDYATPNRTVYIKNSGFEFADYAIKDHVIDHSHSGIKLDFMITPVVSLLDRQPNKNLTSDGQDKSYIPENTKISDLFKELNITTPVKADIDFSQQYAPSIHPQYIE